MKKAFTLLEVMIVLIVMGIVAMISSEIIARMYERYLLNRATATMEAKTELALDIIARRLQNRIKESTVARISTASANYRALADANDSYHVLEWIGYDADGLNGGGGGTYAKPGWSGFCDLIPSNGTKIVSPGSNFITIEKPILEELTDDVSIDGSRAQYPAIIFKGSRGEFNASKFGWGGGDHNYSIRVKAVDDTTLQLLDKTDQISERYLLSMSAYALVPEGADCGAETPGDCNLTLYYDFQPWEHETVTSPGTKKSILIDHITTFRFIQEGRTIHLKLCASDPGLNRFMEEDVAICKEKVIR